MSTFCDSGKRYEKIIQIHLFKKEKIKIFKIITFVYHNIFNN